MTSNDKTLLVHKGYSILIMLLFPPGMLDFESKMGGGSQEEKTQF